MKKLILVAAAALLFTGCGTDSLIPKDLIQEILNDLRGTYCDPEVTIDDPAPDPGTDPDPDPVAATSNFDLVFVTNAADLSGFKVAHIVDGELVSISDATVEEAEGVKTIHVTLDLGPVDTDTTHAYGIQFTQTGTPDDE